MKTSLVRSFLLLSACHASTVLAQFTGDFTPTGNMITRRQGHVGTLLPNGKVLISGGLTWYLPERQALASAELYDPATGTFAATGNMTTLRAYHTSTLLPNGKVLIAGGVSLVGIAKVEDSADLYDPSTGIFTAIGGMTTRSGSSTLTGTGYLTATLLKNGMVLLTGGERSATAELYDPSTGIFKAAGARKIQANLSRPNATLLSNGKVLITRSVFLEDDPTPGELYDPETDTFSLTGGTGHTFQVIPDTASLLANGSVLVTLAYWEGAGNAAEVYGLSNGTFTTTGNLSMMHEDHRTSTLLSDGTVLIFSGRANADIYEPATGTFRNTSAVVAGRGAHAATLLSDGTVLISGGSISWASSARAEIYRPAVAAPSPVLFSLSGDGRGPGAILHSGTSWLVSESYPAVAGEVLEIYGAGLLKGSVIPPQVAIGGQMAEVLFFGEAPGFPGVNQMNVRVPSGVAAGPAVGVRLTYLARPSNAVTIGVR